MWGVYAKTNREMVLGIDPVEQTSNFGGAAGIRAGSCIDLAHIH